MNELIISDKNCNSQERPQEKFLNDLLKILDDASVSDANGIMVNVSGSYEITYQTTKDDIIGKSVYELEKEGFFKPAISPLVMKSKKKVTIVQKNKSDASQLVTGIPIFDQEGNIEYVVSFNSIDLAEIGKLKEKYDQARNLLDIYKSEIQHLRINHFGKGQVIYQSKEIENVCELIKSISDVDANIIITGETGVGKSMFAKMIHSNSKRSNGPYIYINCAAIPENLIESELFGYDKGSFTGALKEGKKGKIELAHNGTLFLDEIGELSLSTQTKILHVIQDKTFRKVGGSNEINIDFRLVTATNQNLENMIEEGAFRRDLYYRLNVVPIHIPSLRDRKQDIELLILHFLTNFNQKYKKQKGITREALKTLKDYEWPGNVRELENLLERLVVIGEDRLIEWELLPSYIINQCNTVDAAEVTNLKEAMNNYEREIISETLKQYGSSVKVGKALGISQPSALRKIKKYNLSKDD